MESLIIPWKYGFGLVSATIGFNIFWRKSFILTVDGPRFLFCEVIAGFFLSDVGFADSTFYQLLFLLVLLCMKIITQQPSAKMERPLQQNPLDYQDVINFIFTGTTLHRLGCFTHEICIADTDIEVEELIRCGWIYVPILSIFQITR